MAHLKLTEGRPFTKYLTQYYDRYDRRWKDDELHEEEELDQLLAYLQMNLEQKGPVDMRIRRIVVTDIYVSLEEEV